MLASVPPQTINSQSTGVSVPLGPPAPSPQPGPQAWITELSRKGAPSGSTGGAGLQPTHSPWVLQRQKHPYLAPAGAAKNSPQDSAPSRCQPSSEAGMCPLSVQAPFPVSPVPVPWPEPFQVLLQVRANCSGGRLTGVSKEADQVMGREPRDPPGRCGSAARGGSGVPSRAPAGHGPAGLEETPTTTWGSGSVRALSVHSDGSPRWKDLSPAQRPEAWRKRVQPRPRRLSLGSLLTKAEKPTPRLHTAWWEPGGPTCLPPASSPHLAALGQPRQVDAPAGEQTK